MTQDTKLFSLDEKIQLLARDIYDAALIANSLRLERFSPSKQIQNLLDEDEFDRLIAYLKQHGVLNYAFREISLNAVGRNTPKRGFRTYTLVINQPNVRRLLGLKDTPDNPVEEGIRLHPKYSYLIINGNEIPLGKGDLHRSLQYWICKLCLKRPNTPIQETEIMAKYTTDYDINGRSRAVRDAVYMLNPKIKKATGINRLFTYSNGYVVFNSDKLN